MQDFWQDFQAHGKIFSKILQDLARFLLRFSKIMARSCKIFAKILQDHGKILQNLC